MYISSINVSFVIFIRMKERNEGEEKKKVRNNKIKRDGF